MKVKWRVRWSYRIKTGIETKKKLNTANRKNGSSVNIQKTDYEFVFEKERRKKCDKKSCGETKCEEEREK